MPFQFKKLNIPDLVVVTPNIFRDDRGFFSEIFKSVEFEENGIKDRWIQVNHSQSKKNVLRGLHYQKNPAAQAKLIRVIAGKIFDVAIDMRKGSPSFGRWAGLELSSQSAQLLYIPVGFAHGFCVLSEMAEVEYFASQLYSPQEERGVRFDDPALGISWPIKHPIVSKKDAGLPVLKEADCNFAYLKK